MASAQTNTDFGRSMWKKYKEPTIQNTNNWLWTTNCFVIPYYCTNSVAEYKTDIRLDLITNWTDVQFSGKQLGYVATNHVAIIVYQGATNEFVLKSVASEKAVWRNYPAQMWVTNAIVQQTNWIYIHSQIPNGLSK